MQTNTKQVADVCRETHCKDIVWVIQDLRAMWITVHRLSRRITPTSHE